MSKKILNLKGIRKLVQELNISGYRDDALKDAFYFIEKNYSFLVDKTIDTEYLIDLMDFEIIYFFEDKFVQSFVIDFFKQNDLNIALSSLFKNDEEFQKLENYLFNTTSGSFHMLSIFHKENYIYESIMNHFSNKGRDSFMTKAIKGYFNYLRYNLNKLYDNFKGLKDSNGVEFFKTFIIDMFEKLERDYDSGTYIATIEDEDENEDEDTVTPLEVERRLLSTGIPDVLRKRTNPTNMQIIKEYIEEPLKNFVERNNSKPWISDFNKILESNLL